MEVVVVDPPSTAGGTATKRNASSLDDEDAGGDLIKMAEQAGHLEAIADSDNALSDSDRISEFDNNDDSPAPTPGIEVTVGNPAHGSAELAERAKAMRLDIKRSCVTFAEQGPASG